MRPRDKGRRRGGAPTNLAGLVRAALPPRAPDDARVATVMGLWDRAMPPRIAKNARPVRLFRGTLTVHVATSAWAQELTLAKTDLLAWLNKRAPDAGVRDLRARVGPLTTAPPTIRREDPRPVEIVPLASLPEELARALSTIGDDAIRDVVREAASRSLGEIKRTPRKRRDE